MVKESYAFFSFICVFAPKAFIWCTLYWLSFLWRPIIEITAIIWACVVCAKIHVIRAFIYTIKIKNCVIFLFRRTFFKTLCQSRIFYLIWVISKTFWHTHFSVCIDIYIVMIIWTVTNAKSCVHIFKFVFVARWNTFYLVRFIMISS